MRRPGGPRVDLVIAVCALLISTLATGASWWQGRILQAQTAVLEQQLGAQVWPYLSLVEGVDNDSVHVAFRNNGLGPAVLRSAVATVDGRAQGNFIDIMHAILGPHLIARSRGADKPNLSLSGAAPGSVLRAGDTLTAFRLDSKRYARTFLRGAYKRLNIRTCYCAIVSGKCWATNSAESGETRPVPSCPAVAGDLLHANVVEELLNRDY